jgi:hypothetical protein
MDILGHKMSQADKVLSGVITLQLSRRKYSAATSKSILSPAMMRNIAVFMLTWFLAIGFHALTHAHKICLEHGEWIEDTHNEGHSESSKIHPDLEDRHLSFRDVSEINIHLKHLHCPCLSGLRQSQARPAPEYFYRPKILLNVKTELDEHASVSTISLLRMAQKTSPPSSTYRV